MSDRPALLFYCQHSLGLGHLVRSLALAEALSARFDVTLLNGGRMPSGIQVPAGVELVNLVPLGHDDNYELVSHDPDFTPEQAQEHRRATLLALLAQRRPAVVFVELYPFGRKKFGFELEPLLDACAAASPRPRVVCSVRDILVNQRRDQARHDERAARAVNRWFDLVLVHADPSFATLEESFRPQTPLQVPVRYTGFVAPDRPVSGAADGQRLNRVIVSAGGGMVGEPLCRAAVAAAPAIRAATGCTTTIVAGPFLPTPAWEWLQAQAGDGIDVLRQVDDLASQIARSAVSVSQCGYNTTMDLLRAGTPAVVVPYSEGKEDEQRRRAERLVAAGALAAVDSADLDGPRLAAAVIDRIRAGAPAVSLDLDGAAATARLTWELAAPEQEQAQEQQQAQAPARAGAV